MSNWEHFQSFRAALEAHGLPQELWDEYLQGGPAATNARLLAWRGRRQLAEREAQEREQRAAEAAADAARWEAALAAEQAAAQGRAAREEAAERAYRARWDEAQAKAQAEAQAQAQERAAAQARAEAIRQAQARERMLAGEAMERARAQAAAQARARAAAEAERWRAAEPARIHARLQEQVLGVAAREARAAHAASGQAATRPLDGEMLQLLSGAFHSQPGAPPAGRLAQAEVLLFEQAQLDALSAACAARARDDFLNHLRVLRRLHSFPLLSEMQRSSPQAERESRQGRRMQLFWDVAVKWGDVGALSELATVLSSAPREKTDYLLLRSGSDPQLCAVLRAGHYEAASFMVGQMQESLRQRRYSYSDLTISRIMYGFVEASSQEPSLQFNPRYSAVQVALDALASRKSPRAPLPLLSMLWQLASSFDSDDNSLYLKCRFLMADRAGGIRLAVARGAWIPGTQLPAKPPPVPLLSAIWQGDASLTSLVLKWYTALLEDVTLDARLQPLAADGLMRLDYGPQGGGPAEFSPVYAAVLWRKPDCLAALMEGGMTASPALSPEINSPLAMAAFDGSWAAVESLLRKGAIKDFTTPAPSPPVGLSSAMPLYLACWAGQVGLLALLPDTDATRALIASGSGSSGNNTPLHVALLGIASRDFSKEHCGVAVALIERQAPICRRNAAGQSPLSLIVASRLARLEEAAERAWTQLVQSATRAEAAPAERKRALDSILALVPGSLQAAEAARPSLATELAWLLQRRDSRLSPLLRHPESAKALLSASLKAPQPARALLLPPLFQEGDHLRAMDAPLVACVAEISAEHLAELLRRGASPHNAAHNGTALHAAVRAGRLDCARLLLSADVSCASKLSGAGETALHTAARGAQRGEVNARLRDELVALIFERAPSVLLAPPDKDGVSALAAIVAAGATLPEAAFAIPAVAGEALKAALSSEDACRRHLAVVLQLPGLSTQSASMWLAAQFATAEQVTRLCQLGASATMAQPGGDGTTPLHIAVRAGRVEVAEALLSAGASVTAVDKLGNTALHFAARDVQDAYTRHTLCALLARAAPNAKGMKNEAGRTALQVADKTTRVLIEQESVAAHKAMKPQNRTPSAEAVRPAKQAVEALPPPVPLAAEEGEAAEPQPPPLPPPPEEPKHPLDFEPLLASVEERKARVAANLARVSAMRLGAAAESRTQVPLPSIAALPGLSRLHDGAVKTLGPLLRLESEEERRAADAVAAAALAAAGEAEEDIVAALQPHSMSEVSEALAAAPWTLILFQEARREWVSMDGPLRRMVERRLLSIARGFWLTDGACSKLQVTDPTLQCEVWRAKFSKGGRIVWDVSPDHAPAGGAAFQDVLRIWVRHCCSGREGNVCLTPGWCTRPAVHNGRSQALRARRAKPGTLARARRHRAAQGQPHARGRGRRAAALRAAPAPDLRAAVRRLRLARARARGGGGAGGHRHLLPAGEQQRGLFHSAEGVHADCGADGRLRGGPGREAGRVPLPHHAHREGARSQRAHPARGDAGGGPQRHGQDDGCRLPPLGALPAGPAGGRAQQRGVRHSLRHALQPGGGHIRPPARGGVPPRGGGSVCAAGEPAGRAHIPLPALSHQRGAAAPVGRIPAQPLPAAAPGRGGG